VSCCSQFFTRTDIPVKKPASLEENHSTLQLEGRMTLHQSFWANVHTADALQHTMTLHMSCAQITRSDK